MKIIDMHTHTFPEKIALKALEKLSKMSRTNYFTNGTEDNLTTSMKEANITYSVILPVATSAEQVSKINDGVIALKDSRFENGIISFGAMHPDFQDPYNEIKRLKEAGIKGIKLHPAYVYKDFDDPVFSDILKASEYFDMPITVHSGIDIGIPEKNYCTTEMILKILEKYPNIKLILAHMGGWMGWDKVKTDLAHAPLLFDTSFSFGPLSFRTDVSQDNLPSLMSDQEFVDLVNALGSETILFGTDCPWASQKEDVNRFLNLPLSEDQKDQILYQNAKKVLEL